MKLALQLAYKNLIGAGLRTWLNVIVLSFALVIIIFFNALLVGWNNQAKQDTIAWDVANGHLLSKNYDPYNAFTWQDGYDNLPKDINNLTPVLVQQGSIYPNGRMVSIAIKGIPENQKVLALPTKAFKNSIAIIPAIIGNRMAKAAQLKIGDEVLLRWRDKNGTFDAANITIVAVFDATVASIDNGQIWIPLQKFWDMTLLQQKASLLITDNNFKNPSSLPNWKFQSQKVLLKDIEDIIVTESIGSAVIYVVLLAIALLAIFDTQVLSIFRRQKEIGTYMALGMTRQEVVKLFTIEGTMYCFLAIIVAAIYGTPLFIWLGTQGIQFPDAILEMGMGMPKILYPSFSITVVLSTIIVVTIASAIVSFIPSRKIAAMNPVLALKGKLQ